MYVVLKNQYINSAYEQLQIISQDDKKRMEYEAREKAILWKQLQDVIIPLGSCKYCILLIVLI